GGCEGGVLAQPNHSAHGTRKCVSWALWFVLSPSIPATDAQVLDLRGSWARLSGAHRIGVNFEIATKNVALSESILRASRDPAHTNTHLKKMKPLNRHTAPFSKCSTTAIQSICNKKVKLI